MLKERSAWGVLEAGQEGYANTPARVVWRYGGKVELLLRAGATAACVWAERRAVAGQ